MNMFEEIYSSNEEDYVQENTRVTIPPREYKNYITKISIKTHGKISDCCSVCLKEFKTKAHRTRCDHYFHPRCLKKQVLCYGPPNCPMCRKDIRQRKEERDDNNRIETNESSEWKRQKKILFL